MLELESLVLIRGFVVRPDDAIVVLSAVLSQKMVRRSNGYPRSLARLMRCQ